MRNAFVKKLIELGAANPDMILLTGDLGFKVLDQFRDKYPKQFFNVGVAESNMAGIAAGLALEGKRVFMYSIAPFATMRCYEQIRNDIAFHRVNVKVVSVGGGFSYGPNGPTHHALTDIAIMRAIPEMTVVCPGDPLEASAATEAALSHPGPVYLRLGRSNEPVLHKAKINFRIGKGMIMTEGEDAVIISTGNMLETALSVSETLRPSGYSIRVVSLHTVKPLDKRLLMDCLQKFPLVFTLEEHSVLGGLGSAVLEFASQLEMDTARIKCLGAPDQTLHQVGSHRYLRNLAGLSPEKVSRSILKSMETLKRV